MLSPEAYARVHSYLAAKQTFEKYVLDQKPEDEQEAKKTWDTVSKEMKALKPGQQMMIPNE